MTLTPGMSGTILTRSEQRVELICADVVDGLRSLAPRSVHCCVTSPPYFGLRSYGIPPRTWDDGTVSVLGEEDTVERFTQHLVEIFREVKRVLHPSGTCFLNLGDCYAGGGKHVEPRKYAEADGKKPRRARQRGGLTKKDLLLVPARVALALQADGWILRQDNIWAKGLSFCPSYSGSVMPESTRDRTTWAHEHVFHLQLSETAFYDQDGCREAFAASTQKQLARPYTGRGTKAYDTAGAQNPSDVKRRVLDGMRRKQDQVGPTYTGFNDRWRDRLETRQGRNLRNVWVIPKENFTTSVETVRWQRVELRVLSDDTMRRVSQDCRVHGDQDHQVATAVCGEHAADDQIHTQRTDRDHAEWRASSALANTNSCTPQQEHQVPAAGAATARNTGSRKRDRDRLTTQPCTAFAGTAAGTDDTSMSPSTLVPSSRRDASKTSAADDYVGVDTLVQMADYSERRSWQDSCSCRYYRKTTQESSHFATFPRKLIEPIVQLATSAAGVCAACGMPRTRQVQRSEIPASVREAFEASRLTTATDTGRTDGHTLRRPNHIREVLGTAWEASCRCVDDIGEVVPAIPATVLDIFAGSGRAGIAAVSLGRSFIGIDLSPANIQMAADAIGAALPTGQSEEEPVWPCLPVVDGVEVDSGACESALNG